MAGVSGKTVIVRKKTGNKIYFMNHRPDGLYDFEFWDFGADPSLFVCGGCGDEMDEILALFDQWTSGYAPLSS
jgi:hypothetical protein